MHCGKKSIRLSSLLLWSWDWETLFHQYMGICICNLIHSSYQQWGTDRMKIMLKEPGFLHSQLLFLQLQKNYLYYFVNSIPCSNQLKLKVILPGLDISVYQKAVHCSVSLEDLNLLFIIKFYRHEILTSNFFPFFAATMIQLDRPSSVLWERSCKAKWYFQALISYTTQNRIKSVSLNTKMTGYVFLKYICILCAFCATFISYSL